MIWEIELDKSKDLTTCLKELKSLGDFVLDNHIVYLDSFQDISTISQKLPIVKCFEITSSNYKNICSPFGRKWCVDVLYKKELNDFEKTKECQERLKFINDQLDMLEQEG